MSVPPSSNHPSLQGKLGRWRERGREGGREGGRVSGVAVDLNRVREGIEKRSHACDDRLIPINRHRMEGRKERSEEGRKEGRKGGREGGRDLSTIRCRLSQPGHLTRTTPWS
jgi:hypothetical protein